MTDDGALRLPEGTRLLHIGPHKTGTTSVQGAFHAARAEVAAQGVHYAGPNRHPRQAAQAAARTSLKASGGGARAWSGLLREVRSAPGRVLISSEWFADASDEAARDIIEALDRDRTHVVVTLRPLTGILPSQWQQFVQAGMTTPYLEWLRAIFDEPSSGAGRRFWRRHRHDRLIARWAAIAGTDRVSAVVVDGQDHSVVLRAFERLLGLRPGTLRLENNHANRSLALPEAELVRALNVAFASVGLAGQAQLDLVLFGAAAALKQREPSSGLPRIETPAWALARATDVAGEIVEGIRDTGIRVDGDLARLVERPLPASTRAAARSAAPMPDAAALWPEIVATGAIGVLTAAGLARSGGRASDVHGFSNQRLRSIFLARLRDAAASRARAADRMPSIHSAGVEVE